MTFSNVIFFAAIIAAFLGCQDSSTNAKYVQTSQDVESCTWSNQAVGSGQTISYESSCLFAPKGHLDKAHCLSKNKGSVGTGCLAEGILVTCDSLTIDTETQILASGYIYDKNLLSIFEIQSSLAEISVCEAFVADFLK